MTAEIWQFLTVILGFFIVALLWLFVGYLPKRTLECRKTSGPGAATGRRVLRKVTVVQRGRNISAPFSSATRTWYHPCL